MSKAVKRPATYDDLLKVPPQLVGEIIEGELYASPRPSTPHERAAGAVYSRLRYAFDDGDGPGGWWILHEPELHLGRDVLVPDVAGWRRATLPELPNAAALTVAPDWICEVLSPSNARFDRQYKLPAYARHGVSYAWVIDPVEQMLEVQRQSEGLWQTLAVYGGDDIVRAVPFEELELSLATLWFPKRAA